MQVPRRSRKLAVHVDRHVELHVECHVKLHVECHVKLHVDSTRCYTWSPPGRPVESHLLGFISLWGTRPACRTEAPLT